MLHRAHLLSRRVGKTSATCTIHRNSVGNPGQPLAKVIGVDILRFLSTSHRRNGPSTAMDGVCGYEILELGLGRKKLVAFTAGEINREVEICCFDKRYVS